LPDTVHSAIHTGMRNLTGQPAIPFSLADSSGRIHTLDEYRGSWLLMVFRRHLG
jgi:peroxiredoxin